MSGGNDDPTIFIRCIETQLRALHLCASDAEASAVSEAISCHETFESSSHYLEKVVHSFRDYFADEISENDIRSAVHAAAMDCWGDSAPIIATVAENGLTRESSDASDSSEKESFNTSQLDSDNEEELIGDGECELCERTIKLTRHHLIPKSTWPRMKKRLWHAAPAIESFYSEKINSESCSLLRENLQKTLGMGSIADLPTTMSHASIRNYLSRVCYICRQCHSAIHRIHTEWDLATEFNTIERLLECQEVSKFVKWANKQRPGKYAVK